MTPIAQTRAASPSLDINLTPLEAAWVLVDALWDAKAPEPTLQAAIALAESLEQQTDTPKTENAIQFGDVLTFLMEERGLTIADLSQRLGSENRAVELANNQADATLLELNLLADWLQIPVSVLKV